MPKETGWKNSRARDRLQSKLTTTSQSLTTEKSLFFNSKFKVQKYEEVPTFDFHSIPYAACLTHIRWNKNWVTQLPYSKSSCKSYDLHIPVCFKPFLFQTAPLRWYGPHSHYFFLNSLGYFYPPLTVCLFPSAFCKVFPHSTSPGPCSNVTSLQNP